MKKPLSSSGKKSGSAETIHIGEMIRRQLEALGMSKTAFGRRINTSSQNVYGIFKRKSIDTVLLKKISDVLEFDFFQYYRQYQPQVEERGGVYRSRRGEGLPKPKTFFELQEEVEQLHKLLEELKKENNYLKEINILLKEKGKS